MTSLFLKIKSCQEGWVIMSKEKENTKNFVLRLDAKTMDAVEKWAADEFRSINGQIQWIINEALKKNKRM